MSKKTNKNLIEVSSYKLTYKQKIDIDTRIIKIKTKKTLETDDEKYTQLIIYMLKTDSFNFVNSNTNCSDIEKWIESFADQISWLKTAREYVFSAKDINFKKFLQRFTLKSLGEFILKYKKCITADIANLKEILERSNQIFNYENLINYASTFRIEAFEAPINHVERIWLLKVAKFILDRYSKIAHDYMKKKKSIEESIYSKVHNALYETTYVGKIILKYKSYLKFSKQNIPRLQHFKNLMYCITSMDIHLGDLNHPQFNMDDFVFREMEAEAIMRAKMRARKLEEEKKRHNENKTESPMSIKNESLMSFEKQVSAVETDNVTLLTKKIKIDNESNCDQETLQADSDTEVSSHYVVEKADALIQTKPRHLLTQKVKKIDVTVQTESLNTLQNTNDTEEVKEKDQNREYSCLYMKLNELYVDGKHTDLVLLTRDKKIRVHKCVLAAHSDRLSEMLENDAKFIDMSKEEPEAVESMLEFMYKNEVENIDKISIHLFNIACEYNIKELLEICKNNLNQEVNIENSSDMFILATKSKNNKLKNEVIKFIVLNRKKVVKTDGFRNMQTNHPELIAELFCYETNDF